MSTNRSSLSSFEYQSTPKIKCCFNGAIKEFQEIQKTFDDIEKCYTRPKLSVLATMYYMVLANVIMLNILIAMFNHSYERVKERSMKINAFQR